MGGGERDVTVYMVNNVRWQCRCGRFLAESAVQSEDRRDDSAYYGFTSRIWATCARCGEVEDPQLVVVGQFPMIAQETP